MPRSLTTYEVWIEHAQTMDTRIVFVRATSHRQALELANSSTIVDEFVRGVIPVDDRAPEGTV